MQVAVGLDGELDQGFGLGELTDIGLSGDGLPAGGCDGGNDVFGGFSLLVVVDDNPGAARAEFDRTGAADATRGASYDRNLAIELHALTPPMENRMRLAAAWID